MWNNENGVFNVIGDFWQKGGRNVIGVAMSHVGDLSITGSEEFFEFLAGRMRNKSEVKVPDEMNRSI